jgi:hypothetical protein
MCSTATQLVALVGDPAAHHNNWCEEADVDTYEGYREDAIDYQEDGNDKANKLLNQGLPSSVGEKIGSQNGYGTG